MFNDFQLPTDHTFLVGSSGRGRANSLPLLPTDHTFLVGSSGLPEAARKAIGEHPVEGLHAEFIDAATEARLAFQGVVPPNRLNPKEVVLDVTERFKRVDRFRSDLNEPVLAQ